MKISWKMLTITFLFPLFSACMTPSWKSTDLNGYLQQFVGKTSQQVQQEINLRAMGYQTRTQPVLKTDQLTYTVVRALNIPIPTAQNLDGRIIQTGATGANSYDVGLSCNIVFSLKDNIVQSYRYQGKAC